MKRLLLSLSFLAAATFPLAAQSAPLVARRLDNGLLVLARSESNARKLEVTMGVLAGFRDEPARLRGLAHLAEHLAMRETRGGVSIAEAEARQGFSVGAATDPDVTYFTTTAPSTAVALSGILAFERTRLSGGLVLGADAMRTEMRRIETEVSGRIPRLTERAILGDGRSGRTSSHEGLGHVTTADLRAFVGSFYVPGNAVIVVESSLDTAQVFNMVATAFRGVGAKGLVPRPIYRDSTIISSRAAPIRSDSGRAVLTAIGPGLQHQDRAVVQRELAAIRAIARTRKLDVTVSLTNDAPVSLITVRAPSVQMLDSVIAFASHDDVVRSLEHDSVTAAELIECEAAGDWRYCFDQWQPSSSRHVLSQYLLGRAAQVWPASPRVARDPAVTIAERSSSAISQWIPVDTSRVSWHSSSPGLTWLAVPGGRADSVYLMVRLSLAGGMQDASAVAALEMWTRLWPVLRFRDNTRVAALLDSLGANVKVRSLPYPPLATSDAFRMIGSAPTAVGLTGVEVSAVVPGRNAHAIVQHLARALTEATADSASFVAERNKQVALLKGAGEARPPRVEVAFRRSLPLDGVQTAWRPEELIAQLGVMQKLSLADVNTIPRHVINSASASVVALGVAPDSADKWLSTSGLAQLRGNVDAVANGATRCVPGATSPPPLAEIGASKATRDLYLARCIPLEHGDDLLVLRLVNALIGGREDAAVAKRLRGETGLAYAFESRILPSADNRNAIWYLHVTTMDPARALAEVREILTRLASVGFSDADVADYRAWLGNVYEQRSTDGSAWVAATIAERRSPEMVAAALRRASASDVNAVAKRLFGSPMVVVY